MKLSRFFCVYLEHESHKRAWYFFYWVVSYSQGRAEGLTPFSSHCVVFRHGKTITYVRWSACNFVYNNLLKLASLNK
jgi:hypothetical protein